MRTIAEIQQQLDDWDADAEIDRGAVVPRELLQMGEMVLEHWLIAHDKSTAVEPAEGFRVLGLHRQAAKGDPSFNACRETCRELAYRYNLSNTELTRDDWRLNLRVMRRVAQHLALFVGGKMEAAELGEFCCSSRNLRASDQTLISSHGEDQR